VARRLDLQQLVASGYVRNNGSVVSGIESTSTPTMPSPIPPTVPTTLNTTPTNLSVPLFGANPGNLTQYPSDVAQIDLYNINDTYLESVLQAGIVSIDGTTIQVDPELDLVTLGYISGKYGIIYRFLRNHLGSSIGDKLKIQEISNDRLEIRVAPNNTDSQAFEDFFGTGFFNQAKSIVLPNLYIYTDPINRVGVFDYIQDSLTIALYPYSIIFKLTTPLPDNIFVGTTLWLAQEVSNPIQDDIILIPPSLVRSNRYIAGPNFDVLVTNRTNQQTSYKDWDDLVGTDANNIQGIVNQILSGSLIEGVNLNIDYRRFDNFTFFGSAQERLLNFRYKVGLLESYEARISELTTDISGLPDSTVTSSFYYVKNITDARNKKQSLIGTFDGYERHLYFNSQSYETSSFGEFYPTTWPKQTDNKPYVLYSVTSSQVEDWFDGIISSASIYDYNNQNNLLKIIPEHIQLQDSNESYLLFVNMIGHYFDLIYTYIKAYTQLYNRNESLLEGFSKDLIYAISQNLGIDFENGAMIEDLWQYALGVDPNGNYESTSAVTSEDRVKETWKRVLANLPHLLKTKGTERSIRALINCYGLPATILRIREYGGPEPEFTSKTDLKYERFFYGLEVGQTSGSSFSQIASPWTSSIETGRHPNAVELRFRIPEGDTREQIILEYPNRFQIKAFQSGSGDYIGFFLNGGAVWASSSVSCSVFDGSFHWMTLNRLVDSDIITVDQTYNLIVKKTRYEKVTQTVSCSLFIDGATSSSYNNTYLGAGNGLKLHIPGSGSSNTSYFQGVIQELRYWAKPLEDSVISNHALAPTSFQGDLDNTFSGSTSSFSHLIYRQTFGSDNIKYDLSTTSSIFSKHPNQSIQSLQFSQIKSASFLNFIPTASNYFEPIKELHSLEWPDLGGNRSVSNKIRIEPTVNTSTLLYPNRKTQKSLTDSQPPDSPRLGVYLSPQNEINQDIAEQFGGISIDDFIGDPQDVYRQYYPDLDKLSNEYYKKYTQHNHYNNYIRIIRYYDASLFQLIKKLVPYRANLQTGLVIEPTILERSKFATNKPIVEDLLLTSSLNIPDVYTVGGFVQDVDGEERSQSGYVFETEISHSILDLSGSYSYIEGAITETTASIDAYLNQFNLEQVEEQASGLNSLTAEVDLGISSYGRDVRVDGSQYWFYTWNRSGSTDQFIYVPSVRYDYAEGIEPTIYDSKLSEYQRLINNNLPPGVVVLPNGQYIYYISYDDF